MIIALILSAVVAFILGAIVGFYAKKGTTFSLQQELEQTKQKLTDYQNTVNEHIFKTQQIMENIYQQFSELQKHSQDYSVKLNLDSARQSMLQPKAYVDQKTKNDADNNAPEDYAIDNDK